MAKILVTGGAGFIGSHLVRHHLKKGDEVWVIDQLSTGMERNLSGLKVRFDRSSIQECAALHQALEWSDRIYHLAASVGQRMVLSNPAETLANNITGCEALLQALSKIKKKSPLLIASSSSVYWHTQPTQDGKLQEDMELIIPSGEFLQEVYSLSKIVNEVQALSYAKQFGIPCCIARIFNTIGPYQRSQYGMVVPNFIKQALAGKPITVFGDGSQTRSFCHVQDTVTALDLLLGLESCKNQIVNVGNDREISILNLAKIVKQRAMTASEIVQMPYNEAYGVDFKDTTKRRPHLEKLKRLTGFTPSIPLEQAIEEILSLHQEDGPLIKLQNEYAQSIPSKIRELEKLVEEVKLQKQLDTLKDLCFFVHKLAGNAGTYGYSQVSIICRECLSRLNPLILSFSPDAIQALDLDVFLKKVKEGFMYGTS